MSDHTPSMRDRILDAAFSAFMRLGFGGASTSEIARLAHVSKRDLYAHFGSKQAMLAGCVMKRAEQMRLPLALPAPTDRDSLRRILIEFGCATIREVSRPEVLATYRLAIMEAENAPDVAATLDQHGRAANHAALEALLETACARGLLAGAEPAVMAELFLAVLMRNGMLVRLLMRLVPAPDEAETRLRADAAADWLLRCHGGVA
jgi:AcrR family transcriptional regulator